MYTFQSIISVMASWIKDTACMIGIFLLVLLCGTATAQVNSSVYEVESGKIQFFSEAPKELISASSTKLRGIVDLQKHSFAFKISMASFQGFNSPLQREHFNENYMETAIFSDAVFTGKIIEEIDYSKNGIHEVRAKGKLLVHGIPLERIIKATLTIKDGKMLIFSQFKVKLDDHAIKIPRVVYEKLSPEINVTVNAALVSKI